MKIDLGSPGVQIGLAMLGGALVGMVVGAFETRPEKSK